MKQIYTDQLISYIFNECPPSKKKEIEALLSTDQKVKEEYETLQKTINVLSKEKMTPSKKSVDYIIDQLKEKEQLTIL